MILDAIMLPVEAAAGTEYIWPAIFRVGKEQVLLDAGYPGMLAPLEEALRQKGFLLHNVTQLWLTHHDHDHMGGLCDIKRKYPAIVVKAGEREAPYIDGRRQSLRLRQAQALQDTLPEAEQEDGRRFQQYLASIAPCRVDELLHGGPILGGQVQILETPGHTEGHLSFYLPSAKALIAGDLVVLEEGALRLPYPQHSFDLEQARKSILAVANLPISAVVCYHGGVLRADTGAIKRLLLCAAE